MSTSASRAAEVSAEQQPRSPLTIIQSLAGGLTAETNPEAEALFRARPETADMVVRSLVRDGEIVGVVGLQDFGKTLAPQDVEDLLAGAQESANEQGAAYRTNLRGYPAVETLLPDRKVWTFVVDRYAAIVAGPEEGVVNDVAIQLVRRLVRQ